MGTKCVYVAKLSEASDIKNGIMQNGRRGPYILILENSMLL
jgi:hypothetical protein